jgi:hypothetical protein
MNGADPCASAVSTDDVRVRHAEGGEGLSSGLAAIVRPLCQSAGRLRSLSKPGVEMVSASELVSVKKEM